MDDRMPNKFKYLARRQRRYILRLGTCPTLASHLCAPLLRVAT